MTKDPIDWAIITASVPHELEDRLEEFAEGQSRSKSNVIRIALYRLFGDEVALARELERHK